MFGSDQSWITATCCIITKEAVKTGGGQNEGAHSPVWCGGAGWDYYKTYLWQEECCRARSKDRVNVGEKCRLCLLLCPVFVPRRVTPPPHPNPMCSPDLKRSGKTNILKRLKLSPNTGLPGLKCRLTCKTEPAAPGDKSNIYVSSLWSKHVRFHLLSSVLPCHTRSG